MCRKADRAFSRFSTVCVTMGSKRHCRPYGQQEAHHCHILHNRPHVAYPTNVFSESTPRSELNAINAFNSQLLEAHGRKSTEVIGEECSSLCECCNELPLNIPPQKAFPEQPGRYRKIADRVHRLRVGQHFDVQGFGTDERSRNRFRCGLYAAARMERVSVRGLPDGSVRVTKVGEWTSM